MGNERSIEFGGGQCPSWCSTVHCDFDHPEDKGHYSDAVAFPAVIPRSSPYLQNGTENAEFIVFKRQYDGDPDTWVVIENTEDAQTGFDISLASAQRLRAALNEVLDTTD